MAVTTAVAAVVVVMAEVEEAVAKVDDMRCLCVVNQYIESVYSSRCGSFGY